MINFSLWFNSFYDKNNRIMLHLLMWLAFGMIIELGLLLSGGLSFCISLFFLGRSILANAAVFYLFFYFIFPGFILRRRFITGSLLTIGCLFIWSGADFLNMLLLHQYGPTGDPGLEAEINKQLQAGFLSIFSIPAFCGSLIFIISSIAPVFCLKIIADTSRLTYKRIRIEKDKALLEVNFLKSQLNPHFLFNTLNSIYVLNMKKDKRAGDVILELSDTLRYTLYESNTEQVILEKELHFLENYVRLESVRHPRRTKITFDCDPSGAEMLTIAPLLTFPFIENAFKHGLGTSLKDAWLEISARVIDETFYFTIRNSKNEENNSKPLKGETAGIGVTNTKTRLALLYPGKHILTISNTPDQYSIALTINLKNEQINKAS